MHLLLLTALLLLVSCGGPVSTAAQPERVPEKKVAVAAKTAPAQDGFDFYVLSLSWSPGFCATPAGKNDDHQCAPGRRFAFVLHGLWPQFERKGWPENCSTEPLRGVDIAATMEAMPSERLIRHEWSKHGTCSGLPPAEYFRQSLQAFRSIQIPARYRQPLQQITVDPDRMQQEFGEANPSFGRDGFVVQCTNNGRFLQEVRACLTKDLTGRACPASVLKDACRSDRVIMRPVR